MNKYPLWKYLLLAAILVVSLIYSAPNLFGEDPALQISMQSSEILNANIAEKIESALKDANIKYKSLEKEEPSRLMVRFFDAPSQLKAKDIVKDTLGDGFVVALNLAPVTPKWLQMFGAKPMKLGLDLRGGMHFLLEVDVDSILKRRLEGFSTEIKRELREAQIRYVDFRQTSDLTLSFLVNSKEDADKALSVIRKHQQGIDVVKSEVNSRFLITGKLTPALLQEVRNYTVEQTMTTLRNRVNELGVAEAVVHRQGLNHVVVELPGIQDAARAKEILGKTATLEVLMHDYEHDLRQALTTGRVPPGSKIVYDKLGRPEILKKRVILTGDSITGAMVGPDERGMPAVQIRVGGSGLRLFKDTTRTNVKKKMAVVLIETKVDNKLVNGEWVRTPRQIETLISLATIQSPLGSNFQITGLGQNEAKDLALLLRSGSLPATISIVEERTVGPSLGQENIRLGIISIEVGLALVLLAMVLYYSVFGVIANFALCINIVLLVAILSLIGATLTLPGIAGIVLTVGMAVDANVLIFERIREELRNGMSPQAAIHSGFDRALSTIIDANLTTLIVGVILFSVGTGPVKGFAVTLCIGILTSMLTAITGTRAMVNLTYGGRAVKKLQVGI